MLYDHHNASILLFHVCLLNINILLYMDLLIYMQLCMYLVDCLLNLIMHVFPDPEPPIINILYSI